MANDGPPRAAAMPARESRSSTVRAALVYFAFVIGTGFVLGVVRVPFIVPRIGERWAELAEMPLMAAVVVWSAGYVLRRFPIVRLPGRSLFVGILALALLVSAELALAALQSRSLGEYLASRDRVSGSVYLAMLLAFGLMPRLRLARHRVAQGGASIPPPSGVSEGHACSGPALMFNAGSSHD